MAMYQYLLGKVSTGAEVSTLTTAEGYQYLLGKVSTLPRVPEEPATPRINIY